MKLSKKVLTMGIMAALSVSVAATAFAADLTVKSKEFNNSQVKIATPVIHGSAGGAQMDATLTLLAAKNTINEIYKYLPSGDKAAAVSPEQFIKYCNDNVKPVEEGMAYIKGSSFLVNEGFKKDAAIQGADMKYNLKVDYNVYTASDKLLSLRQDAYAFTGGAHGISTVQTLTVNAETGKVYSLSDMFVPGSDYKGRLEQLIAIQQKGGNRLAEKMGNATFDYEKVTITGNEKFYVDSNPKGWGLHILYNQGEVGPMAAGVQNYFIPIDTISDIIDWDIK